MPKFAVALFHRTRASALATTANELLVYVAVYVVFVAGAMIVCDWPSPSDHDEKP